MMGMKRKKIALLAAQADEEYQSEFIRGTLEKAFAADTDVYVFSMLIKYQNSKSRECGDSNIFNLVNFRAFDGVIVLADTIQTPGVEKKILEKLQDCFPGPVVCIDTESDCFYTFWTDGYQAVYDTISHLIEKHGMTDIAYVTGRRLHVHSIRRMEAYRAAMEDHGLKVRDDRQCYGDFWYFSGTRAAEDLLRDPKDRPQAIVAANDPMAIGVAIAIENAGLRIPEDIAVAGYGSSAEGQSSPKPVTSPWVPGAYYGGFALEAVLALLEGKDPGKPSPKTSFFMGESCGCGLEQPLSRLYRRQEWGTGNSEGGFQSLHDFLNEDMMLTDSVEDFFRTVYDYIYFLNGVRHMDIYIDERWEQPEELVKDRFLSEGYPDRMSHVLSYDMDAPENCIVQMGRLMETDEMREGPERDWPEGHFFVPLFYEDKTFGYAVFDYGDQARSYDTVTRHWMNALARGLETLRRTIALKEYSKITASNVMPKFPMSARSMQAKAAEGELSEAEQKEREEVERILDENRLTYYFQPIVRATDGEIYSYEALMRSASEWKIPPLSIIRHADGLGRLVDIEKYTFLNVLHAMEDKMDILKNRKVFINSIPGVRLMGDDEKTVFDLLHRHSDQVVVEMTEQAELSDETLQRVKSRLEEIGVDIAIDDYGTGYSNVSNLLRYMPYCVKIDRSLLSEIQNSSQKQHFVRNVIEFCHENQILALAEGVETREELQAVIRLGADLIQGYYVARPAPEILASVDSSLKMEISRFYRERLDGISDQVYIAGKTPRVIMNNLIKEDKTTIIIGDKEATCRDITIAGNPNVSSNIHIEVMEGYSGTVTLENVSLANQKQRPCIRMAENTHLTLRLVGENRCEDGGILVPEDASLTLTGEGNLKIRLNGTEVFGIGNETGKRHGPLSFYQDGEVLIESTGNRMVGIGSDLGGQICIHKGKYTLNMSGSDGVGIGSEHGSDPIYIENCDLSMDFSFKKGVCIGSVYDSMRLVARQSLLRFACSGTDLVVIGTLTGEMADIFMDDLSFHVNLRADISTALGSLEGASKLMIQSMAYRYKGAGITAYLFGGKGSDTDVTMDNMDLKASMEMTSGIVTNAAPENFRLTHGIALVNINGEEIML